MAVWTFLEDPRVLERRACVHRDPGQAPRFREPSPPLPAPLRRALARKGIEGLYAHQARALELARQGVSWILASATASGKSLAYQLPVLESLLADWRTRALFLYPTKALARDQIRHLRETFGAEVRPLQLGIYDGDATPSERAHARGRAHIVFANPDILHYGLLPNHSQWARFLARLRWVVLDEAHVYRGIFGSHVANVLRRLRRLAAFYGGRPQFLLASATLGNPEAHARRLTGVPVVAVAEEGAPSPPRTVLCWVPPYVDRGRGRRQSPNWEAAEVLARLLEAGIRTLVFTNTRRQAELIAAYARQVLSERDPELAGRVAAYRAGYLPEDRRRLEQALFSGELLGAVATSALELGIDIGDLEAAVLVGYPGSLSAFRQRLGRAGRGREEALGIWIVQEDPLDQYFLTHPRELFERPPEPAYCAPHNPYVLSAHLLCAAEELPLTPQDVRRWWGAPAAAEEDPLPLPPEGGLRGLDPGDPVPEPIDGVDVAPFGAPGEAEAAARAAVDGLAADGELVLRGGRWHCAVRDPARRISLRSSGGPQIRLWVREGEGRRLLEVIERWRALEEAFPGAVYLHQGEPFRVLSLDLEGQAAELVPHKDDTYTQPLVDHQVRLLEVWEARQIGAVEVFWGRVRAQRQTIAYRLVEQRSGVVLGVYPLELPVETVETAGLWWLPPEEVLRPVSEAGLDPADGLHAVEHAAIGLLPLLVLCDRSDLGGVSSILHPDVGAPVICIYDGHPGGVGLSEAAFRRLEELWTATLELIRTCPCEAGCPSCIQSPKCGNNNEHLDKEAARLLLEGLVAQAGVRP